MNRRTFLMASSSAVLLQACGTNQTPLETGESKTVPTPKPKQPTVENTAYFFASSGIMPDTSRIQIAINRLSLAGFNVINTQAAYRRYYRFAGTVSERVQDFQTIIKSHYPTPKLILGSRGGYGAIHLLPLIDWASLADKLKENQSLFMGFSDVCTLQLALLAKTGYPSFAGPMVYSEFGNPNVSTYTLQSFINTTTQKNIRIQVPSQSFKTVDVEGIFWGGNLSVLASLVGTPYMPNIEGGILFLEDVSEQPYRIERMLYTLYLSGILKKQKAIVLGNFRMDKIKDFYDANYNFNIVVAEIRRLTGLPVLTDFPFGHIANKTTIPLGVNAHLQTNAQGYEVQFFDYPHLNTQQLNLNSLITPVVEDEISMIHQNINPEE